ncbi:MAG: phage tail tape measure protein [Bacteroidales bacterium]|nr:phage tail tape measure protein [Bacteroidales bacterium]
MAHIRNEDLKLNVLVNADETRKKILDLTESLKKLKAQRKEMKEAGGADTKEFSELNDKIEKTQSSLERHQRSLRIETMNLRELKKYIRDVHTALQYTDPNTQKAQWDKYNGTLRLAKQRLRELSDQSKETTRSLQSWSDLGGMAAFFQKVWSLSKGVIQHFAKAIGTIANFEQANANLSTILGKNVSQITRLTESARELGKSTEYTASQVTGLQTELAKLGFSEDEILGMQKSILGFSTAVGTNLPEAAALAGATLRMFGLTTRDSEDVMGALAVATNKSALNFSYLQTAMSIVGPVAKTFGFSVKDTAALLGTLANAGFDASSAATATRNILLNLANANGKLAKALGSPVKTFPELISGLQKLNEQGLDLASTLDLTDKRSVAAFNSFLGGAESALDLRNALENVDGELGRISSERLNTIEGSLKLLKSAWEGLTLSLTGSKGLIKGLIDLATSFVSNLNTLIGNGSRLTIENLFLAASFASLVFKQKAAIVATKSLAAGKALLTFWSKANSVAIRREAVEMRRGIAAGNTYRTSTLLLAAAKSYLTLNTKAAGVAMSQLNKKMKANPAGFVVAGLMAIASVITHLIKNTRASANEASKLKKAQKDLAAEYTRTTSKIEQERRELDGLNKIIQESAIGSQTRKDAIEALNSKYGEYLPHLLSERDNNEEIAKAIGKVNVALEERARLQARDAAMSDIEAKKLAQEESAVRDIIDLIKSSTGQDPTSDMIIRISDAVKKYSSAFKGMEGAARGFVTKTGWEMVKLYNALGGNGMWGRSEKFENILKGLRNVQFEATKTETIVSGLYGNTNSSTSSKSSNAANEKNMTKKSGGVADEKDDNWSLNRSETFLKAKAALIKRYNKGEIKTQEEFEKKLYELEVSTLRARIDAKIESGKDLANLEVELAEKVRARKEKIEKEKEKWSLDQDKDYLMQKADLTDRYNKGEIKTKEEYDKQLYELEVSALTNRISTLRASGDKTEKLEADLQDRIKKRRERIAAEGRRLIESEKRAQAESVADQIKLEGSHYEENKIKFQDNAEALEALESQHQRKMKELRLKLGDESIKNLQTQYENERLEMVLEMQNEINICEAGEAAKAAIRKKYAKKIAELDRQHLAELVEQMKEFIEKNKNNLTPEQLQQYYKALEALQGKLGDASDQIVDLKKGMWSGGNGELFGVSQAAWDRLFTNLANGKFDAEDLTAALEAAQGAANEAFGWVNKVNDLQTSKEKAQLEEYKEQNEEKKKILQKRLDAGIISQGDYEEEVQRMEDEQAAREKEMAQKQAEREKTAAIVQAVINTALGVTQTLAQWGLPWGLIPAGVMLAMGAAEIAMISAQPTNAGYAEGGLVKTRRQQDGRPFEARLSPDKRGWIQSPTILVGEEGPEYVIPADGVRNPALRPFLNTIEQARRHGTLRSLNMGAVYPASVAYGQAKGGVTIPDAGSPAGSGAVPAGSVSLSTESLERLLGQVLAKMDKPVPAVVSMLGKGGIVEAQDNYERMRKAGRLGK